MVRPSILLLLPLVAAGCAGPQRARVTPVEASGVAMAAAAQVKRCYRWPQVPSAGRRIITRLHVRFSPDGALAATPQIVYQQGVTPENSPYAALMAEAASMAVMRCSPLHLPPELHRGGWDSIDLTFSLRLLV
ncbi:MAG TPA: hypothetical protein VGD66_07660 [Allosphingosinicella sp.]|jgi:hypothetical protein